MQEDLLKRLRDETGITYESLNRDLNSMPQQIEIKSGERAERADDADASLKASRFVIASLLFGADYAEDFDITQVEFINPVHAILSKYVLSKRLMQERIHLSEVFEFFEDNTPESEEISRILDYSDNSMFNGDVDRKYFADCVKRLKIDAIDGKISSLTAALKQAKEISERNSIAERITSLVKQREKIKNGVQ